MNRSIVTHIFKNYPPQYAALFAERDYMSYLDVPRIHIAGRFFTDPSSINNDPAHYDPNCERPSPWQMPKGKHYFKLVDCAVRSVLNDVGASPTDDPLIGAPFLSTDLFVTPPMFQENAPSSAAKMIDLDVYQQGVSTIYGLQVQIAVSETVSLIGNVLPSPSLNSYTFSRVLPTRGWNDDSQQASYGNDINACGNFQTCIRVPIANWPVNASPVLDLLRARTITENGDVLLALKFTLDAFNNVYFGCPSENCYHGRLTGCIGPMKAGDPLQAPGARWLAARALPANAPWFVPTFNSAPFQVDATRRKLVVDLANSLCLETIGGPPVDLGVLSAVMGGEDGPVTLGALQYDQFGYENNAGIAELDLTDAQVQQLAHSPLALVTSRQDIGPQAVLSEDPSGLWWAVDTRILRMSSEANSAASVATIRVHATQWGLPAPHVALQAQVVPVQGTTPGATVPPTYAGDTFNAEGALTASITPTDYDGYAQLTLNVIKDPGSRTPWLDSQLYFVNIYRDAPQQGQVQEQQLSCQVWARYPVNPNPTWDVIAAMMAAYNRLYPAMREMIDLTDEHSFRVFAFNPPWSVPDGITFNVPADYSVDGINSGAIPFFLTRDGDDPRFMPPTRDLSPNKIQTILNYIKNNPPQS